MDDRQMSENQYLDEVYGDEMTAVVMRQSQTIDTEYLVDDDPWRWSFNTKDAMFMTPTRAQHCKRLLVQHHPGFVYTVDEPEQ